MNIRKFLCLVSALALATSAAASSQSLVELAKQEKQRRAKLMAAGSPARVYTDGDRIGTPPEPARVEETSSAETATAPAPGGKKEKTPEELAAERQADWNERLKKTQDEIKAVEGAITGNERALASMFNITPARADLVNRVEEDKKKVAGLKQTLVDLEDERRRAGMPRVR